MEAALLETSSRFPLSSRVLLDLDKAGVDDRVIDLMVALSFPRSFAVRPSGPDNRLTPFPPLYPDFIDASYEYPYFFGTPYYSNYYYSPYFFSPFGYSYLRYYPQFYRAGGGRRAGRRRRRRAGSENQPPERGRVINGQGYTRVDRRGDSAVSEAGAGAAAPPCDRAGSRGTVSPRGYTAGDAGGGSSSSSSGGGGGGSSSSGGSSSGGSSGATAAPAPRFRSRGAAGPGTNARPRVIFCTPFEASRYPETTHGTVHSLAARGRS